jgi:AAA domain
VSKSAKVVLGRVDKSNPDANGCVLDGRGTAALTAELDHINPDVLIIDPLINLLGGVNGNDNSPAALLMGYLARVAATRRISVALAHHAFKAAKLSMSLS